MQLIKATIADLDRIGTFFRQAWDESGPNHLGFTGATEETIDEIASKEFLKKRLLDPNVNIYIIKVGPKVLGFASTRTVDREAIELSGIVMLESATGKGFGTRLVEKAVSYARQSGFRRMVVKTESDNERAISFYKKMGFTEIGEPKQMVEETSVNIMILQKDL